MKSITATAAPKDQAIAYGGTPSAPITPTHAIIRKTGESLFTVTTLDRRMFEFTGPDKIITGSLKMEAVDAKYCTTHDGEPMWFSVKHARGVFCRKCHNERAKQIREQRANGEEPTPRSAAAKAARLERVTVTAAMRERTREQSIAAALRGCTSTAGLTTGSAAYRAAYVRCLLTTTATQYGLTAEQAATLAEIEPFEFMTWAEFRRAHPRKSQAPENSGEERTAA